VFELGEDLFDGVEVGAVRREEKELGSGRTDGLSHGLPFVAAEIIEDDDVAGTQRRSKDLLDVSGKALAVDGPVEDAGRLDPIMPKGADEGERFPVAVRRFGDKPLSAVAPPAQGRHVGLDPGLVNEHEPPGIEPLLVLFPTRPAACDVRAILF